MRGREEREVEKKRRNGIHTLADDSDTERVDGLHDGVGNLTRQILLNLKGG